MKRCRTCQNNVTGYLVVDRISSLHEQLLIKILCLLPTKDAVRTSILSRRWRRVYSFLNNLEFDCSLQIQNSCFISHVDTVLRVCHSRYLTRFCLKLGNSGNCLFDLDSAHLHTWISFPLTRSVKEIDLSVHVKQPGKLPPQIFSLHMLEVLKIDSNLELENPGVFGLTNLKVLHLAEVVIPDGAFLTALLSTSSSLVELDVDWCDCGNSPVIKISHRLLKRLSLHMPAIKVTKTLRYVPNVGLKNVTDRDCYQRTDVILDTPNLEYLYYYDDLALRYAGNFNSLVEVAIEINSRLEYLETCFQSMLSLLSLVVNVRSLSLCDGSYKVRLFLLHFGYLYLYCVLCLLIVPVIFHTRIPKVFNSSSEEKLLLPNLNHLELYICNFSFCFLLLDLLYSSPILQRLTLPRGGGQKSEYYDASLYDRLTRELEEERETPEEVPSCLRSHLTKIEFLFFRSSEEDLLLLKYLFRNALVLQELEVACFPGVDIMQAEIAIKNLPRKSLNCSIKIRPSRVGT